jgi:hypothetical protein
MHIARTKPDAITSVTLVNILEEDANADKPDKYLVCKSLKHDSNVIISLRF